MCWSMYIGQADPFKHRGESGRILIRMNSMVFDKRELAAPAEPVGSPAEALSFNTPATTGCPLEGFIQAVIHASADC